MSTDKRLLDLSLRELNDWYTTVEMSTTLSWDGIRALAELICSLRLGRSIDISLEAHLKQWNDLHLRLKHAGKR